MPSILRTFCTWAATCARQLNFPGYLQWPPNLRMTNAPCDPTTSLPCTGYCLRLLPLLLSLWPWPKSRKSPFDTWRLLRRKYAGPTTSAYTVQLHGGKALCKNLQRDLKFLNKSLPPGPTTYYGLSTFTTLSSYPLPVSFCAKLPTTATIPHCSPPRSTWVLWFHPTSPFSCC